MWIFMNDAFLSIVRYEPGEDDDRTHHLLVRARLAGDIERVFGAEVSVAERFGADYRFGSILPAAFVSQTLRDRVAAIDYSNFKGSIGLVPLADDPFRDLRHGCAFRVWGAIADMQRVVHGPPYGGRPSDIEIELEDRALLSDEELALGEEGVCPDCGESAGFYCRQCFEGSSR